MSKTWKEMRGVLSWEKKCAMKGILSLCLINDHRTIATRNVVVVWCCCCCIKLKYWKWNCGFILRCEESILRLMTLNQVPRCCLHEKLRWLKLLQQSAVNKTRIQRTKKILVKIEAIVTCAHVDKHSCWDDLWWNMPSRVCWWHNDWPDSLFTTCCPATFRTIKQTLSRPTKYDTCRPNNQCDFDEDSV